MYELNIVAPWPVVAITGTVAMPSNLLTPNPKEAAVATADGQSFRLDLGTPRQVDSVFVGYTSASDGATLAGGYGQAAIDSATPAIPVAGTKRRFAPSRHFLLRTPAPFVARYIEIGGIPNGMTIGVAMAGLAFVPTWGQEYGSGRPITDTGSADRLFGGGFGVNDGVRASGYQFTLGDLTDDDRDELFDIVMELGGSRSGLIVEDPAQTPGLNERIHWGIMPTPEPYERFAAGATRWGLRINDWA